MWRSCVFVSQFETLSCRNSFFELWMGGFYNKLTLHDELQACELNLAVKCE
jgi:hypothetical protein